MDEEGVVVATDGDEAIVEVRRGSACAGCHARHVCIPHGAEAMRIRVLSEPGTRVGDRVRLSIESSAIVKASFIVYILPLIGLILFAVIGGLLAQRFLLADHVELCQLLSGLVGFLLVFMLIWMYDKRLRARSNFQVRINRIDR